MIKIRTIAEQEQSLRRFEANQLKKNKKQRAKNQARGLRVDGKPRKRPKR